MLITALKMQSIVLKSSFEYRALFMSYLHTNYWAIHTYKIVHTIHTLFFVFLFEPNHHEYFKLKEIERLYAVVGKTSFIKYY